MIYEDSQLIDIHQLKRLPQYAGMKDMEIQELIDRIARIEQCEWEKSVKAQMDNERREDAAYLEACKDPVLPEDKVDVILGIIILRCKMDEEGFISGDTIDNGRRKFKLSLGEKCIYL